MDENKKNELNKALAGIWDSLTDEQKKKAKACENMDELTALAASAGVELPDEMLDAVSGGRRRDIGSFLIKYCPYCKGKSCDVYALSSIRIIPENENQMIITQAFECKRHPATFCVSKTRNMYYTPDGQPLGDYVELSTGC